MFCLIMEQFQNHPDMTLRAKPDKPKSFLDSCSFCALCLHIVFNTFYNVRVVIGPTWLIFVGMPPHMAPRPGMPHMAPAPAAGAIPSRPAVPAAQPAVTKPLFPSAAQVGTTQMHVDIYTHKLQCVNV